MLARGWPSWQKLQLMYRASAEGQNGICCVHWVCTTWPLCLVMDSWALNRWLLCRSTLVLDRSQEHQSRNPRWATRFSVQGIKAEACRCCSRFLLFTGRGQTKFSLQLSSSTRKFQAELCLHWRGHPLQQEAIFSVVPK